MDEQFALVLGFLGDVKAVAKDGGVGLGCVPQCRDCAGADNALGLELAHSSSLSCSCSI